MNDNPFSAPQSPRDATDDVANTSLPRRWKLKYITVLLLLISLMAYWLSIASMQACEAARRTSCNCHFKLILAALHNYHDLYHALPPAYIVDETGRPLHSWRALILPQLDKKALYDSIDFTKPWNDPVNEKAYQTNLPIYQCPSAKLDKCLCTCQAIVAPEAAFHPIQSQNFTDITDGSSNTLLLIEVDANRAVHWMSPIDDGKEFLLTFDRKTRFPHYHGTHIAMGDGTVRYLVDTVDRETRRALVTIRGNDLPGEF